MGCEQEVRKKHVTAYVYIDVPVSYTHLDVYKRQDTGLPVAKEKVSSIAADKAK